jgi:hypothetical protein
MLVKRRKQQQQEQLQNEGREKKEERTTSPQEENRVPLTPKATNYHSQSCDSSTPVVPPKKPEFWKKRCFSERNGNATEHTSVNERSTSLNSTEYTTTNHRLSCEDTQSPAKRQRLSAEDNISRDTVIKCVQNVKPQIPVTQSSTTNSSLQSDIYLSRSTVSLKDIPYSPASSTCSDRFRSCTPHSDTSGKIRIDYYMSQAIRNDTTSWTIKTCIISIRNHLMPR